MKKYSEKRDSGINRTVAFSVCILLFFGAVIAYGALRPGKYALAAQLVLIAFLVALLFFFNRYVLTVFVYTFENGVLRLSRGKNAREVPVAELEDAMITLICPAQYAGPEVPSGEVTTLNAAPSFSGKTKGFAIYCDPGSGGVHKILFDPSADFLARLSEDLPGKILPIQPERTV